MCAPALPAAAAHPHMSLSLPLILHTMRRPIKKPTCASTNVPHNTSSAFPASAAYDAYRFTHPDTQVPYVFNNTPVSSYDAQSQCNLYGGHLVWFASLQEQQQVEQAFIAMGYLFPTFHTNVWIGYRAAKASTNPADFKLLDKTAGPQTYSHWGTYKPTPPGKDPQEPNNLSGGENCAVGNFSQVYNNASGWADASCGLRLPFLCRLYGGWEWLLGWWICAGNAFGVRSMCAVGRHVFCRRKDWWHVHGAGAAAFTPGSARAWLLRLT